MRPTARVAPSVYVVRATRVVKPTFLQGSAVAQKEEQPTLPTWTVVKPSRPSQELESPLTPSELFAISASEAITNCHVVVHAKSITVSKGPDELSAEIITADPQSDRCYLKVRGGALKPILGVRDYGNLVIGETVYTIGSPRRLDSTLAQGLLSGLRNRDGTQYIQTSAPISKGSSGGGLFDDRGNLIGITKLVIKDSQNLNFAIAASEYWK